MKKIIPELVLGNRILCDVSKIKPYWRNARNNKKTIELIKESVTSFGFFGTITVDKNYTIITGHARFNALVELGYKNVPIEMVEHLNDNKVRQYRIADNKISEKTDWVAEDLMVEIKEIGNINEMQKYFDVKLDDWLQIDTQRGFNPMYPVSTTTTPNDVSNNDVKKVNETINIECPNCNKTIKFGRKELKDKLK
tara:strand:+ start:10000 stop:10584 length:585 start_codon:yes stop_codon:yes gene_type:complete